jgi:hypothetical protein
VASQAFSNSLYSNNRETPRRKAVASQAFSNSLYSNKRETPRHKAVASQVFSEFLVSSKRETPRHKAVASVSFPGNATDYFFRYSSSTLYCSVNRADVSYARGFTSEE